MDPLSFGQDPGITERQIPLYFSGPFFQRRQGQFCATAHEIYRRVLAISFRGDSTEPVKRGGQTTPNPEMFQCN
jgi:hypothetical protein